jgi:hypothetical protein
MCPGGLDFNNYIEEAASGAKAGQNINHAFLFIYIFFFINKRRSLDVGSILG